MVLAAIRQTLLTQEKLQIRIFIPVQLVQNQVGENGMNKKRTEIVFNSAVIWHCYFIICSESVYCFIWIRHLNRLPIPPSRRRRRRRRLPLN